MFTRGESVTAVKGKAAYSYTALSLDGEDSRMEGGSLPRACSVAHALLALSVQLQSDVSQSPTSLDYSCMSLRVNCDISEIVHVDNQMAVFASQAMCAIAMASAFCVDFYLVCDATGHSILDMLDGLWYSIRGRDEGQSEVERLDGLCVVCRAGFVQGDLTGPKAIIHGSSLVESGC